MSYRSSQLLASIAFALLVVWIATPLFAVVHVVVEEHRYCAEHQRLEEGGEAHDDEASSVAASQDSEDSKSERSLRESTLPQRSHELCASVDCLSLETLRTGVKGQNVVAMTTEYATPLLPTAQHTYRLAQLLVAPKCSPPLFV